MQTQSVPAPLGGWNARDPLDGMQPTDAISLVNWYPQARAVFGRGGSVTKVSGINFGAAAHTLATYTNGATQQIIYGSNGKLYTVDPDAGTATQIGTGFSSSNTVGWQDGHFNGKMVLCNGVDMPQVWNGTTLNNFVGSLGVPTINTVTTSTSGGTLAAATYYYKVTATYPLSTETTGSNEKTVTTTGTTSSNTITWSQVSNATGYKVYRSTIIGTEQLVATISSGTTLSYVDTGTAASGALPGSDTSCKNIVGLMNFKGRAVYWLNNALGFYYSGAGAFQVTLNYFPLDYVFLNGGYVVYVISWSRDNGDGVDDMMAIVSSTGEMLVYQGTDPSSALTWEMTGRFKVGVPLGVRAHGKVASQEILLTSEGFSSTDEAIATQTTDQVQGFGGKIVGAASLAVGSYANNFGWQCIYYARQQMFIINVPINQTSGSGTAQSEQYVRNTDTGAWARFTGWNATDFTVYKNRLYFCTDNGSVVLADTDSNDTAYGWGDDGVAVLRDCTQAYIRLSNPGMKTKITGVQLVTNMQYPKKASVNILSDYYNRLLPAVNQSDNFSPSYWDISQWDSFYWGDPSIDPTQTNARPVTYPVRGYGFANAVSFRYNFKLNPVVWYSTNLLFENAGV